MKRAFTLIELMIVVGIMTLGVGAGIVSFQETSKKNQLEGAADKVRQTFAQAKANAQSGKKDCELCNRTGIPQGLKKCGLGDDPLQGWSVGITPAPAAVGPNPTPAIIIVNGVCGPIAYPAFDGNRQTFGATRIELPANIQVASSPMPVPLLFRPAGGGIVPSTAMTIRIFDMTTPTLQKCFTLSGSGEIAWKTGTCP